MSESCSQCGRPLQQRAFGTCMYCGAGLPPHLRPSEADRQDHRQRLREAADAEIARLRRKRDRDSEAADSDSDAGGWGGGDCDSGGGDCGGD